MKSLVKAAYLIYDLMLKKHFLLLSGLKSVVLLYFVVHTMIKHFLGFFDEY